MIIETLSKNQFIDRFNEIRPDNFSREALERIFDIFNDPDIPVEFDPIMICCEFTELTLEEFCQGAGIEFDESMTAENLCSEFGYYDHYPLSETILVRD